MGRPATMPGTEAPATIDYRLSTIDYEEEPTMETEKVCPIIASAGVIAQGAAQGRGQLSPGWDLCVGPACAWYDAARERCAILGPAVKAH